MRLSLRTRLSRRHGKVMHRHAGDAINALLVAAGHNLRLILATLALWRALILLAIAARAAKPDTSSRRCGTAASMA